MTDQQPLNGHARQDRLDELDTQRALTRTDVLSTSEVAELLGIPRSTVHELARRGELPARRVGRRWLFLRDRVAAAVAPLDDPAAWRPNGDIKNR
jgi:excisionase family DNA binding protein